MGSQTGPPASFGTPQEPVPVKKQEKYNLKPMGGDGRNDLAINTACRRIYEC